MADLVEESLQDRQTTRLNGFEKKLSNFGCVFIQTLLLGHFVSAPFVVFMCIKTAKVLLPGVRFTTESVVLPQVS